MRACLGVILLLALVGCAEPEEPPDVLRTPTRFESGQIWTYRTREAEEHSRITILDVGYFPKVGNIVHVYLDGIGLLSPQAPGGVMQSVAHMAFREDAIEASVLENVGRADPLPKWRHAYDSWLVDYRKGRTPIMASPVAKTLDELQKVLNENR